MTRRARGFAAIGFLAACESQVTPPADRPNGYAQVPNWPAPSVAAMLGEVSAVDVDAHGHVFVFHRARRGWDTVTREPIAEATVLMLDSAGGQLLAAWGANQFRLPHGLTVDRTGNVWLADAALHQAFMYTHDGARRLTVGVANTPGRDPRHFNRPTDVAVRDDGGFYVTDGYENQRVVHFRSDGGYVREWGRAGAGPGEFALPHMIAARGDRLYVSDRENERIAQFDTAGAWRRNLRPLPNALVYATAVDSAGRLYAALRNDGLGIGGVARLSEEGTPALPVAGLRSGTDRLLVHDIAVDANRSVYIAETRPGGLRKYVLRRSGN